LEALGECVVYERTPRAEIIERMAGAEVAITNKVPFDRATIEALGHLRYIGVTATGYNIIDVEAAGVCGVTVTNVPDYCTRSVAQAVFALILELTNHVGHHARTVREGRWSAWPDFTYWDYPIIELAGLTMGIVGLGDIGSRVAGIARAFGMNVLAATRTPREVENMKLVDVETLFASSDIVSLHCPLTPETDGLVSAERIALMRPDSYLINTARGGLVDEAALAEALNSGRIAGAALDVLSTEPPCEDNPLLTARNCLVTPHVAWASRAARERLLASSVANLGGFLAGAPENVVS